MLEGLQELIANFSVLAHLKLNLAAQRAVARRLHVVIDTELLLLLVEADPTLILLQMTAARGSRTPLLAALPASRG